MTGQELNTSIIKKRINKRANSDANSEASIISRSSVGKQQPQPQQQQQQQPQQRIRKKKVKSQLQTIPVDSFGIPVLPLTMNAFTLYSLGDIIHDKPNYHTDKLIFPVGFVSTRIYSHYLQPEQKCLYTCKILEDGDSPRFEITTDGDPDFEIAGPTPDFCHERLMQFINANSDTQNVNVRPLGDWFFGLSDPTILNLIQNSHNARKLSKFKGLNHESDVLEIEEDNSANYEALQRHMTIAAYHTVPEIKEEPPDELLDL